MYRYAALDIVHMYARTHTQLWLVNSTELLPTFCLHYFTSQDSNYVMRYINCNTTIPNFTLPCLCCLVCLYHISNTNNMIKHWTRCVKHYRHTELNAWSLLSVITGCSVRLTNAKLLYYHLHTIILRQRFLHSYNPGQFNFFNWLFLTTYLQQHVT
jgi:hypothetical protein